jgi:hypothetical protein
MNVTAVDIRTTGAVLICGVQRATRAWLGQSRRIRTSAARKASAGDHVEATDGEIGHVHGFVLDDEAWAIRYIEVATRNWLPGKKVLVSPAWIEQVGWKDSKVYAALSREAIKSAPEYLVCKPITRDYEDLLHLHYGRPPYWLHEAEHKSSLSMSRGV